MPRMNRRTFIGSSVATTLLASRPMFAAISPMSALVFIMIPLAAAWRQHRGLHADPLAALRESGYVERIGRERGNRHSAVNSYA